VETRVKERFFFRATNSSTIIGIYILLYSSVPFAESFLFPQEIGEEPKYLSPRLDLVDLKADAAVWNVKLQEIPRDTDEYNNFYSNDCTKGVAVTFELVGGIPAEAEPGEYPREGSFLCCSFSKLSSSSELLILSRAEIEHPEGDEFQSFSHVWEICPENWINDDLEFLDRYLS
jgi:hypothetical protein